MGHTGNALSAWLLEDNTRPNHFSDGPPALVIRAGFLIFDLAKVLALNYEQSGEVLENMRGMPLWLRCGEELWWLLPLPSAHQM